MAKITIDGPTSVIHIDAGVTEIEVISEIYSEWKRWMSLSDNSKYAEAIFTVGGEPISDVQSVPQYFFLINGWTVHIDSGEKIEVSTNLYTFNGDKILYVTSNNSTVVANNSSAVIVDPTFTDITALLNAIKDKTDQFTFIGGDVVSTLDGEEVTLTSASAKDARAKVVKAI